MPSDKFWNLLEQLAQEKLGAIFGPDLERVGSTCAVAETTGLRSLGCYWATAERLFLDQHRDRRRVRFSWQAGGHSFNVPVTDIRLYAEDHVTRARRQSAGSRTSLPIRRGFSSASAFRARTANPPTIHRGIGCRSTTFTCQKTRVGLLDRKLTQKPAKLRNLLEKRWFMG